VIVKEGLKPVNCVKKAVNVKKARDSPIFFIQIKKSRNKPGLDSTGLVG
jgi:hypothetical protein